MRRASAILLLLAIGTLVASSAADARGRTMSGAAFRHRLLTGGDLPNGITVTSEVNISGKTVSQPFTCRGCTFKKALVARGTTFDGIVDLRGSKVLGAAFFTEATFKQAALFGSPLAAQDVRFDGGADFTVASFGDIATFQFSVFKGATFRMATFTGPATFAVGSVKGSAYFDRAQFQSRADFSEITFHGPVDFGGSDFGGPADFGAATFQTEAFLSHVRFENGASFLDAKFPQSPATDSFVGVQSGSSLDFSFANLARPVDFTDMDVNGTINFHGATLGSNQGVTFGNVSATSLVLDVGDAVRAMDTDSLPKALDLIESSANARGDLGTANDAHYERRVLASQQDGPIGYALDVFFYRWIAGYLVRPLQPLAALFILALLATLLHVGRKGWPHPTAAESRMRSQLHRQWMRVRRIVPPVGDAYFQTLAMVIPGQGPSANERPARWLEATLYRVLFVCVVIGFANSNPTLKQMLDAIR